MLKLGDLVTGDTNKCRNHSLDGVFGIVVDIHLTDGACTLNFITPTKYACGDWDIDLLTVYAHNNEWVNWYYKEELKNAERR